MIVAIMDGIIITTVMAPSRRNINGSDRNIGYFMTNGIFGSTSSDLYVDDEAAVAFLSTV